MRKIIFITLILSLFAAFSGLSHAKIFDAADKSCVSDCSKASDEGDGVHHCLCSHFVFAKFCSPSIEHFSASSAEAPVAKDCGSIPHHQYNLYRPPIN